MNTDTFCTIISADYLFYAEALCESLLTNGPGIHFNVFVVDGEEKTVVNRSKHPNMIFSYPKDVCKRGTGKAIFRKYYKKNGNNDRFRWSMKPVLLKYLLDQKGYKKAIFIDPDVFFFSDWQFLFDELEGHNILLSPHWRSHSWKLDLINFRLLLTDGICNGGFIGATKGGIDALIWWAESCCWKCEKNYSQGLHDDQRYLDLMPFYFERVKILRHPGCNLAEWNRELCQRSYQNGTVSINRNYPVVFIHFTKYTVNCIWYGDDRILKPHLETYFSTLKKYQSGFNPERKYPRIRQQIKYILINQIINILAEQPIRTGFRFFFPGHYLSLLRRERRILEKERNNK